MISQRTQSLLETQEFIGDADNCSIPKFSELPSILFRDIVPADDLASSFISESSEGRPSENAVDYYLEKLGEPKLSSTVYDVVAPLLEEFPIMTRCAPLAPFTHDHLSFAGTYPSFIPKPLPQSMESVYTGIAFVLAGKHTKYAQYYHERHNIPGDSIGLGVMVMELVSNPAVHGTAYSHSGNVRAEYVFDPQLDQDQYALQAGANHLVDDRFGVSPEEKPASFCQDINFNERITGLLRMTEKKFAFPVDVEFLISAGGIINLVQVRRMSSRHDQNWYKYYRQSHEDIDLASKRRAIINSVGNIETNELLDVVDSAKLFEFLVGLDAPSDSKTIRSLLVKHPEDRVRDHLQYSALEDELLSGIYHADPNETRLIQSRQSDVYSNGDTYLGAS